MQPTALEDRPHPDPPDLGTAWPDPDNRYGVDPPAGLTERVVTGLFVVVPAVAVVAAALLVWGHGIGLRDVVLAVVFYAVIGHAIAIGFHRLFAHRSFRATRPLRITLAVLGSMAFEGGPIGWVADHRRHHAYTDRDGDPHSPRPSGPGLRRQLEGLWHAHTGWLFSHTPTSTVRYADDLVHDRDLVVVDRLFPVWCALSLALPLALGWVLGGSLWAGATALLWAGLVRIFVLHHVTWSVNSVCHTFGRRPFATRDLSTNVGALAVISFGESWHNAHHAFPTSSRLGVDRFQLDSSAALIGAFERFGWAVGVRRPSPELRDRKRA